MTTRTTTVTRRIYLDSDERYEIYTVKAAERPHLLSWIDDKRSNGVGSNSNKCHKNNNDDDDDESDNDGDSENENEKGEPELMEMLLPLVDGCDVPGWRQHRFIEVSEDVQGALNVGLSCSLLRRESQLPVYAPISSAWTELCDRLLLPPRDGPPVVDCQDAAEKIEWKPGFFTTRFAIEWEKRNLPVVVNGCTETWTAMPRIPEIRKSNVIHNGSDRSWTFDNLVARFGNISWRFSDTHGEMMSLRTYAKYINGLEGATDDSPLAIYDAEFGDDKLTADLLNDYNVPACFSDDLFAIVDNDNDYGNDDGDSNGDSDDENSHRVMETSRPSQDRPPYRWILIGPERSGTGLHIDPLWTNAWVTVLEGCKRWMLFPPSTPADRIALQSPQISSVVWFHEFYDRVTSSDWPDEWKPVEVLQRPGETVFVPNGWPHLVLNLARTVAVTHNYASEFGPFERMWHEVETEEPGFAKRWCASIQQTRPDLVPTRD